MKNYYILARTLDKRTCKLIEQIKAHSVGEARQYAMANHWQQLPGNCQMIVATEKQYFELYHKLCEGRTVATVHKTVR